MRTVPLLVLLLSRASAWEQQEHAPHPKVLQLLTSSADWLLDHSASGICLRKNGKCEGVHPKPAWTGKSDDDGGNYVTGNLARTLLAAGKITGNKSYTDEGLAWADTFCTQQRNTTSAAGSPAGFWPAEIYFADTGTGVTALAYAVHLADTPWRKARYLEVLTRYASYVLEGCASPPGNESTRWGHPIGTEPHPYSWIIQTGPDAGALGDGYWNGTLNDWPYTIATATTGAAFFAELFALTENDTYKTVANGAVDWLIRKRAPNGANIYTFDHPDRNDGKGATILTETTTCTGASPSASLPVRALGYIRERAESDVLPCLARNCRMTARVHVQTRRKASSQSTVTFQGQLTASGL
jgi:hypothetical protein